MKIAETFRISFKALSDRKVRSYLTILMVVVGSSLMVTLNGIVAGLGQFATDVFHTLAPNILFITSIPMGGSEGGEEGGDNGPSFLGQGLVPVPVITLEQVVADRIESLPHVSSVIPSYQGRIAVSLENRSQSASVLSVQPENLEIIAPALEFAEGSTVNPEDESAIYLPLSIASKLSGLPEEENGAGSAGESDSTNTMIGQEVTVDYTYIDLATASRQTRSENFTVAGIMEPVGNPTIDRAVVFNLEAGNDLLQKSGRYDSLFVVADSGDNLKQVETGIRDIYGTDIGITTSEALLQTIRDFTAGFGSVISSIALVALLVGSVGIITTMYTSVTERTREIGVMKAIGARDRSVLALFLAETAIIGIIGASMGLVLGVLGGYGTLSLFSSSFIGTSGVTPQYPWSDLVRVWGISFGLSIAAGLYPAWKASKLSPIAALRRE